MASEENTLKRLLLLALCLGAVAGAGANNDSCHALAGEGCPADVSTRTTLALVDVRSVRAAVAPSAGDASSTALPAVTRVLPVTPDSLSLSVGTTGRITAGKPRSRALGVESANPAIATATASGDTIIVTAVAPGNTLVRVKDGPSVASIPVSVIGTPASPFSGNIILGAPTATSIIATVLSPDQGGKVTIDFGVKPGIRDRQVGPVVVPVGTPVRVPLEGLAPDTRYYYRMVFQSDGGGPANATSEYAFHTARPPGSSFTFTVQADPHLDENSDLDVYRRSLDNALADAPDFHIDLGDTFMCEKHCTPFSATLVPPSDSATVDARYAFERQNFGRIAHSAPLFLVNGNHDGELGWLADGTARNLAVWATLARKRYFANPVPDGFYGGDKASEPFVGQRASWYAWHWGDALFVVLDPYWNTKTKSNSDGWSFTLGATQYAWLEETLAASAAKYKFVFVHNLVGGLDGQMRGGVEAAPFFEWGGRNADGTQGFAAKRPGWSMPIHSLLLRYDVTAVFHGHDHVYVRQDLDGIAYQELPQPSAKSSSSGPSLAAAYHYASGTIRSSSGHLRVSVSPAGVNVDYVRAWLPKDETTQRVNGEVADQWSIKPRNATR